MYIEEKINSETIYDGKILKLNKDIVKIKDDITAVREIVYHRGAVAIVPFYENGFFLVRQFRYAVGEFLWEIPAGIKEKDEKTEETAERELIEEINFRPVNLVKIVKFYSSPGFSNEIIHIFLASELVEDNSRKADDDEFLERKWFPIVEVENMLSSFKIIDSKTLIGLSFALKMIKNK